MLAEELPSVIIRASGVQELIPQNESSLYYQEINANTSVGSYIDNEIYAGLVPISNLVWDIANGDAANKIGTYALARLAHYFTIPFYVLTQFPQGRHDDLMDALARMTQIAFPAKDMSTQTMKAELTHLERMSKYKEIKDLKVRAMWENLELEQIQTKILFL